MTITAKIIQDSISSHNKRITTFELEYPRFIHSEFLTHRQFSRNSASSRAIPIETMHKHVKEQTAYPIHWGKNQSGMQAKQELDPDEQRTAKTVWDAARDNAIGYSRTLMNAGLHKQIANRVTEPFQTMKTVVTATEFKNWFWLRNHTDAQPEIHELASKMYELYTNTVPVAVLSTEWHVPYVERKRNQLNGTMEYFTDDGTQLSADQAIKISASCCAQVSYRRHDTSLEKAFQIYDRLINSEPVHASPVEHQATPMIDDHSRVSYGWETGVTHMDRRGRLASGNFYGWIQYRQLIPGQAR